MNSDGATFTQIGLRSCLGKTAMLLAACGLNVLQQERK